MKGYPALLERLYHLTHSRRGRLDLTVMKELCHALGDPQKSFATIHIAGTNGKGSVTTMVAKGLQSKYQRVGRYTSPHIATFRERISLNGNLIPEEAVKEHLPPLFALIDAKGLPASFFEVTTALAFRYFKEREAEIAVIEVGLGGRLDATNIIVPELTVITSISFDHSEVLGLSLEEIAREKGGIIKPHVPLIIGPTVPLAPIAAMAEEKGAPLYHIEEMPLDYRQENRAIAKKALQLLKINETHLNIALKVLPPCRFERHTTSEGISVIFDVAHNKGGLEKLAYLLCEEFGKESCHAVIALSATKELNTCLQALQPAVAVWYPVAAENGRSWPSHSVAEALRMLAIPEAKIRLYENSTTATALAYNEAKRKGAPLLIAGSFFIMAAARQSLGLQDEKDPYDLNEGFTISPEAYSSPPFSLFTKSCVTSSEIPCPRLSSVTPFRGSIFS